MLEFMIRRGRPQLTILATMTLVAVCAVVLGCIVDLRRIRRAQVSFGRRATSYAQLEKLERAKLSDILRDVASYKQGLDREKKSLERLVAAVGRRRSVSDRDILLERIRLKMESYDFSAALARDRLLDARRARVNADRLSTLKQVYANAAGCLWLPFAPGPLAGRNPESEHPTGMRGGALHRDEIGEADECIERNNETKESPESDVGEPPGAVIFRFRRMQRRSSPRSVNTAIIAWGRNSVTEAGRCAQGIYRCVEDRSARTAIS
jgi:hypothetical protein